MLFNLLKHKTNPQANSIKRRIEFHTAVQDQEHDLKRTKYSTFP